MLLVTGSAGHLGEALLRDAQAKGIPARGLDQKASAYTDLDGDIADPSLLERAFEGVTQSH